MSTHIRFCHLPTQHCSSVGHPHPTPPMRRRRQSFMALNKWQPPSLPPSYFISPFGFCSIIPPHPPFVQFEGGGGAFVVLPLLWPRVKPPTLRTVSWGLSSKILLGGISREGKGGEFRKRKRDPHRRKKQRTKILFRLICSEHITSPYPHCLSPYACQICTCTHPRRKGGPFSFCFPPHLSTPQRKKEEATVPIYICMQRTGEEEEEEEEELSGANMEEEEEEQKRGCEYMQRTKRIYMWGMTLRVCPGEKRQLGACVQCMHVPILLQPNKQPSFSPLFAFE